MAHQKERSFKYLLPESYLAYIKNSVGTKMFRSFYVKDETGKVYDVLKNGDLSCSVYVSTILRSFDLIDKLHFTVTRTLEDVIDNGWKKVALKQIKPGDLIIWESKIGKDGHHTHIGFYIGNNQAVSNSSKKGEIEKHHYTYNNKRTIMVIYRPNWKKSYAKS